MRTSRHTVFIIEDDQSVRDALGLLLGLRGYPVAMFADAESFLKSYESDWYGCLLIDIKMPGMDGLALQKYMLELGSKLPVIVMTGRGDVDSARTAFRLHAVDFLEKPIDHRKLIGAIEEAFNCQANAQTSGAQCEGFTQLLAALTAREKEVMEMVVAGRRNRDIAARLGISARTVEVHKARMITKLRVENVPDLVRLYLSGIDTYRR